MSSIYAAAPGVTPNLPKSSASDLHQRGNDKLIKPSFDRISNMGSSTAILADLTQNQKTMQILESMDNIIA